MIRSSPLLIAALFSLACAENKAPPEAPPVDRVAHCAEVVQQAANAAAAERYDLVASQCVLPLLHEPACRDAIVQSLTRDPAVRASLVASACAAAYCPHIGTPKPNLCLRDVSTMSPAEVLIFGGELFARVRLLELGAPEAERFQRLVDLAALAPPRPVTPTAPAPGPTPFEIRMKADGPMLVIAIGDMTWNLPAKPVASDFDPPAKYVAQHVDPDDPVAFEVGANVVYAHVTGMLNALAARKIRKIQFAVIPAQ